MDLESAKDLIEAFGVEPELEEATSWLIAEVERLQARLAEYKKDAQMYIRREADLKAARDRAGSSLTRSKAEGRIDGLEEAAKIAEGPHGPWGSPLESQRIAFDIRYRAEQECKEMEEVAKLANQK